MCLGISLYTCWNKGEVLLLIWSRVDIGFPVYCKRVGWCTHYKCSYDWGHLSLKCVSCWAHVVSLGILCENTNKEIFFYGTLELFLTLWRYQKSHKKCIVCSVFHNSLLTYSELLTAEFCNATCENTIMVGRNIKDTLWNLSL